MILPPRFPFPRGPPLSARVELLADRFCVSSSPPRKRGGGELKKGEREMTHTYSYLDSHTVGELLSDPGTPAELRGSLEHNLAVRAINRTMKLSDVRELFELRALTARYERKRADDARERRIGSMSASGVFSIGVDLEQTKVLLPAYKNCDGFGCILTPSGILHGADCSQRPS